MLLNKGGNNPPSFTFSVRLRFKKEGLVRFISHLDFTRSILRAMGRADIPFLYSQGYSPHPKISFGPPLSLGWESETEMMEIELAGKNDWKDLSEKINKNLPEGLMLSEVVFVSKKGLLNKEIKYIAYRLSLPRDLDKELLERKLSAKFADKKIEIFNDESRSGNDLTKNYFVLKVEESVKMKDVLNEITESSGWFYIFVKRLAFYDKDGNRI
ncbi:MAG: TIGR03936 family radical SAM-associated protein [bacterium]|nr:TIGR03936 family radical SAM-associated protein [bacterium]